MDQETISLKILGVSNQRATYTPLVEGIVKANPHVRVLCPTLARGEKCNKGIMKKAGSPFRPELLIKNFGNPDLQLSSCEGCTNFLLRVKIENE